MSRDVQRLVATLVLSAEEFVAEDVVLEGDRYHHLFRSKRLASGTWLRVVDGRGASRRALVGEVSRSSARLELGGSLESRDPARQVTLVAAVPKSDRASWLVEKASELGVFAIRWLQSSRSPRELSESALDRHRRVAVAALEQSGGSRLPQISGSHPWTELPELIAPDIVQEAWMLDPEAEQRELGKGAVGESASSVAVLVGPEGGWNAEESEHLRGLGVSPVGLGQRILRVETAAIIAAGLCLAGSGSGS